MMRKAMLVALALTLAVAGSSAGPSINQPPAAGAATVAWVQMTGEGQQIRAVAEDGRCPRVIIDGRALALAPRDAPDAAFPALACQIRVPPGARQASLDGRALPLLTHPPRRILIFGDTGCRLHGEEFQDCDNASAWPFPAVVRRAAAMKPDLVIHVGDYYYRESPCPAGRAGCAGSPHGDAWPTWRADFFNPAAPLLALAPFVFARGNHETCARGGQGWSRLLDAGAPGPCRLADAAYAVDLGDFSLYVVDSAEAQDRDANPWNVGNIRGQLDSLGSDLASRPGWIVTHRPVWAVAPVVRLGPLDPLEVTLNKTEQTALRGRDISAVRLIVSGHIHHFASYDFGPVRPSQLVAGTGGDASEDSDTRRPRFDAKTIDGLLAQRLTFARFGYFMLDRDPVGEGWSGVFRDMDDKPVATCRLTGRDLTCKPAPGA
jgi:hypothetical protein